MAKHRYREQQTPITANPMDYKFRIADSNLWRSVSVIENPSNIPPEILTSSGVPGGKFLRLSLPNDQDYYSYTQEFTFGTPKVPGNHLFFVDVSFRLSWDSDYPGVALGVQFLDESDNPVNSDPLIIEFSTDTYIWDEKTNALQPASFLGGVWYHQRRAFDVGGLEFSSGLEAPKARLVISTGNGFETSPVEIDLAVSKIGVSPFVLYAATDSSFNCPSGAWTTVSPLRPKSLDSYNSVFTNYLLPGPGQGRCKVSVEAKWDSGSTVGRGVRVLKNGVVVSQSPFVSPQSTGEPFSQFLETTVPVDVLFQSASPVDASNRPQFASLDQISFQVYQASGSSRGVNLYIKVEPEVLNAI